MASTHPRRVAAPACRGCWARSPAETNAASAPPVHLELKQTSGGLTCPCRKYAWTCVVALAAKGQGLTGLTARESGVAHDRPGLAQAQPRGGIDGAGDVAQFRSEDGHFVSGRDELVDDVHVPPLREGDVRVELRSIIFPPVGTTCASFGSVCLK